MVRPDNRYSRFISWLKVLLPVGALALLSTMFLISKSVDPTTSLSYARVNLEELTGEQRIDSPRFSSVTADGAAITFEANSAVPDPDQANLFTAKVLAARIETPDGGAVDINAATAVINGASNRVDLAGGVTLVTSTDYHITTDQLSTAMDSTHAATNGPVTADGPMGHLTAGQAEITREGEDNDTYLLVFKDGVKLIYQPQTEGEEQ
ncbi:LPS export ABC transporter periplasmic protein LptC [Aliiroseovarius sediminis]|uniref:LPS export ABC transporter periplasmic protein LptC n=1 Tax=Aliiroseovarius sediminis TaxID=2925839 RepID=UPI001F5A9D64|nr:LPS export ABC transporter periplasmic protein LptC [Aliiroseovarius sediminis]MCI2394621.1 LPS export ABC transporter periplasmic protein LptC [Aliiroseovarius sediminis]